MLMVEHVPQGKVEDQASSRSKATDIVSRALQHAAQALAKGRTDGNMTSDAAGSSSGITITLPSGHQRSSSACQAAFLVAAWHSSAVRKVPGISKHH